MSETMEILPAVKPRRRTAVRPSSPRDGGKVKATIVLSTEAYRRLSVHATWDGEDRSALVERLICEHLRRYVVQDRARPEAPGEA